MNYGVLEAGTWVSTGRGSACHSSLEDPDQGGQIFFNGLPDNLLVDTQTPSSCCILDLGLGENSVS
jgi:hypothetical protein